VTALPTVKDGIVTVDFTQPGLGLELLPGLDRRADAVVRTSRG
jgi:hypothetical protein